MGAAKTITKDMYEADVVKGTGVAVIDFGATWCAPCQALAPKIDEMAQEFDGKALIGKVDIDEESDLATELGVMSVPTVIFFKDGEKVEQIAGNFPDKIRDKLQELVG